MNYVYLMHGYCIIRLSLSLSFFGIEATLFPFELEMLQIYFFLRMSVLSFIFNERETFTVNRETPISVRLLFHDISLRIASFSMLILQMLFLEPLHTANIQYS